MASAEVDTEVGNTKKPAANAGFFFTTSRASPALACNQRPPCCALRTNVRHRADVRFGSWPCTHSQDHNRNGAMKLRCLPYPQERHLQFRCSSPLCWMRPNQAALAAFSFLDFGGRFGSGCVLRTASVSISRNSALVFGGSRVGLCHWVIDAMWGCRRQN